VAEPQLPDIFLQ